MKIHNLIKNTLLTSLILSFAFTATFFGFRPSRVDAANYFGGMKTMTLICTCSGNQLIYINNYAGGGSLALLYNGSGRLFSNNNIYGTYLLGSYSSGGGECKMISYPECYSVSSDGSFDSNPGTGTS